MPYKRIRFLTIYALCLLLTACNSPALSSSQPGDSTNAAQPLSNKVITLEMNGQTIEVQVGDVFQVSLATIPVEDFNWEPDSLDTNILEQQGAAVYQKGQDADDAGGNVVLTFKAVGTGSTALNLIYTQPRENNPKALFTNSFGVTIIVK